MRKKPYLCKPKGKQREILDFSVVRNKENKTLEILLHALDLKRLTLK